MYNYITICVHIYIHIYAYMNMFVHYSKTFGANLESVALTSFGTSDGFREVCVVPLPGFVVLHSDFAVSISMLPWLMEASAS